MAKPKYFSDDVIIDEPPPQFVARLAATLAKFQYVLASQTEQLVVFNKSGVNVGSVAVFGVLGLASRKRSTITLAFSATNPEGRTTVRIESDNWRVGDLFQNLPRAANA